MPVNIGKISGKTIEISCNELIIKHKLKLYEEIEICGNIINSDLDSKLDTINQTIATISGGSQSLDLTNLNTKITTLSGNVLTLSGNVLTVNDQLNNILTIINNLDVSYVSEIELASKNYALDASLTDYALTSSLNDYALTSSLNDYALNASLNNYALNASLNNYALNASLNNYALDASLNDYVLTSSLNDYAKLTAIQDISDKIILIDASLDYLASNTNTNTSNVDLTGGQDASFTNVDISGILKINDYSFPQNKGNNNQILKLDYNNNQLFWADDNTADGGGGTVDLKAYDDASFTNVDISGSLKINNINVITRNDLDNSFGEYTKTNDLYTRNQIDNSFVLKTDLDASLNNYYIKEEIDNSFGEYTKTNDLYTRNQIDNSFIEYTKTNDLYTRNQIDNSFVIKTDLDASLNNYYTKESIDNSFIEYTKTNDLYTRNQIDNSFVLNTDLDTSLNNYYTKESIDNSFIEYTKTNDLYTRNQIDNSFVLKSVLDTSLNNYYTKESIDNSFIEYTKTNDLYTRNQIDNSFVLNTDLDTSLNNYYTKESIDNSFIEYTKTNDLYTRNQIDNSFVLKSVLDTSLNNYYTKESIDNSFIEYTKTNDLYTRNQIDNSFVLKSVLDTSLNNYYTKESIDNSFTEYTKKIDLYTNTQIDNSFVLKSVLDTSLNNYYTKESIDNSFTEYTKTIDLYTNTQIDNSFVLKSVLDASLSNYYTKESIDNSFTEYTKTFDLYTRNQIDNSFVLKSVLDTSLSNYYIKEEIDNFNFISSNTTTSLNTLTLTGPLNGPATFVIDPAGVGDNTGMVIIRGGLQVDGSSTIINSSKVDISDHTILLASNAQNQAATNGAGIEISGNKYFKYKYPENEWETNIDISANISGNATTVTNGIYTTNSVTALNDVTSAGSGAIITSEERNKLNSIENDAKVNVQADYNETNSIVDSFIKNKPNLFSGNYNDLTNQPNIILINSDASLNNVDISGNLKISNGNIDISHGIINFFATDEQLLGPDTGIAQKVQDLSNSFGDLSNSVGDLSNNLLTSNNDASLNNVEINGTIKLPDSSNNGYGNIGELLTSGGTSNTPYWVAPYTGGTGINIDASNIIYTDATVINTTDNQTSITGNKTFSGYVGINFTGASSYPLRIYGSGPNITGTLYSYVHSAGAWAFHGQYWTSSANEAVGLYVDEGIRAARMYFMSDRRIKKDIVDIQDDKALLKLRTLKPKIYKYIDPRKGKQEVYGFIAQEVGEVIPYSVKLEKSYLPSHMCFCKIVSTYVNTSVLNMNISHDLIVNDVLSFRNNKDNLIEDVKVIEIIDDKTIKIDKIFTKEETTLTAITGETENDMIYLYGKEIPDLHTLNKDSIWTVATAALQEVDRQLQAEKIKTLNLTSRLDTLEARLMALESK